MKEIIRLENIKRNFIVGDEVVHALRGVSFTIYEGEFVTIMGTSGSGKSTLLNTLGCLDTPTSGEYYLDGVSVRTMGKSARATLRNRKIGFVFQNYNLLPKTMFSRIIICYLKQRLSRMWNFRSCIIRPIMRHNGERKPLKL